MSAPTLPPTSGTRLRTKKVASLFPEDDELDDLLVERIRVFYQRVAAHLRELETYKQKRGICIAGISCTRKAIEGIRGGKKFCAHHAAATKAGMKLRRWEAYSSEYGRLRKKQIEDEKREAVEREAEEAKRAAAAAKAKPAKKRRAA